MYYFELNKLKYILSAYLFVCSFLFSTERGWIHPETGWEVISGSHMSIFSFNDVYIDNELADSQQTDAIGIFFNEQCIGWAYYQESITFITAIGDDGNNEQYPSDGEQLFFYIYDDSNNIILDLQSTDIFPNWNLNTMQNINETYACSLNLPIQGNGECYNICDVDLNLDSHIDIFDIILLIEIFLCSNCEDNSCGDINSDNEIDIQDILILLNITLGN